MLSLMLIIVTPVLGDNTRVNSIISADSMLPHSTNEMLPYSTLQELNYREGTGDALTNTPTGRLGVTRAARRASKSLKGTPDDEVALMYLIHLESKWMDVVGYVRSPEEVKLALLDASYNLGERVMRYRGVRSGLLAENYSKVMESLLLTANVGGKSVKGIAKRRAGLYNGVTSDRIVSVEQRFDGTIIYHGARSELFRYRPWGGRHEKSSVGILYITDNGL